MRMDAAAREGKGREGREQTKTKHNLSEQANDVLY
jgi:hypothetical protein